jgi:hypothetical protein
MEVHRNPRRAEEWSEAGSQDVQRRFGHDAMLRGYDAFYVEMLASASAPVKRSRSPLAHA